MDKKPLSRSTQQQKKHPPKWAVKAAKKLKRDIHKKELIQGVSDHWREIAGNRISDAMGVPPESAENIRRRKARRSGY